jgi:Uma2 family endonuclease
VSVQCKPADPDSLTIDEPIIVVEVVSPSSARTDLGEKVADYFRVPSVRHYLIVDPIARIILVHSLAHPNGTINTKVVRSGAIELDPPGLSVSVENMLEPAT